MSDDARGNEWILVAAGAVAFFVWLFLMEVSNG